MERVLEETDKSIREAREAGLALAAVAEKSNERVQAAQNKATALAQKREQNLVNEHNALLNKERALLMKSRVEQQEEMGRLKEEMEGNSSMAKAQLAEEVQRRFGWC